MAMKNIHYITTKMLLSWLLERMTLQQQLIEAMETVIVLQKRIDNISPKDVPDEEVFWHLASGIMSKEAAQSDDLKTVRKFLNWNLSFAKKHIKPYVNAKVYIECSNQMTRGLVERVSELENRAYLDDMNKKRAQLRKSAQQAAQN